MIIMVSDVWTWHHDRTWHDMNMMLNMSFTVTSSRSTPISSLPLILPQVDSKLVQALHSFVSHTAIFLSCKKRNHLQARASKVSSKNDWEKEKRAKVIIIWGQAEL